MTPEPLGRACRGLIVFCALVALHAALASPAGAVARLLSFDAHGATLEFRLEGLRVDTVRVEGRAFSRVSFEGGALVDPAGLPELPAEAAALGVPRFAAARLTLLSVESEELACLPPQPVASSRLEPGAPGPGLPGTGAADGGLVRQVNTRLANPAAYSRAGLWPREVAALGAEASLRYQRVQTLGVRPLRYDAARGRLWVARRITVRVDFEGPAGAPAAGALPVDEGPIEESLYRNALLNYEQARGYRLTRPAVAVGLPALAPRAVSADLFPDFKLRVDTTGVYSVTFAQLERRSPGGLSGLVPVADLRMVEKLPSPFPNSAGLEPGATQYEREVPIRVVDLNANGVFDSSDYVVFYGRNLKDRFGAKWFDADYASRLYTDGEVYWLGVRPVGSPAPLRIPERPASLGLAAPYTPATFGATVRREDRFTFVYYPDSLNQSMFMATDKIFEDTVSFAAADIDSARRISVRASFRGGDRQDEGVSLGVHQLTLYLERPQGAGRLSDLVVNRHTFSGSGFGMGYSLYDSDRDPLFALTGASLSSVRNVLRIVGEHPAGGVSESGSGAFLEWFEIGYHRRYLAPGNIGRLNFDSGDTLGPVALKVGRFRESSVEVYDVTDPAAPLYVDVAAGAQRTGSFWQVSFQDTAVSGPHRYYAGSRAFLAQLPDAAVLADTASALAALHGADLLIVSHESLESEALRLAAEHTAQGLSVAYARIGDVFDEFDGGRRSAVALKRFLRRAFYRWSPAPRYVLLVGEASMNAPGFLLKINPTARPSLLSHRDLVPAGYGFGSVPLGFSHEVAAEDHWYVVGLDTTDQVPVLPAMAIGRIPASTPDQARAVVDKVIQYQQPVVSDAWRSRLLLVADDMWSNGIGLGNDAMTNNFGEFAFRSVSQKLARVVTQEGGFGSFGVDSFYLAGYTDSVHACDVGGDPGLRSFSCMSSYGHDRVGPLLWNRMGQGQLVVNYQGHGNASLWAHERILENSGGGSQDLDQIGNDRRPFLVVAFACHVNDFDRFNEFDSRLGDCSAERMLYAPLKGAIGSFASSCFEWLPYGSEPDMNVQLFRSMFVKPPQPTIGGDSGVKWILGDILRDTKVNFVLQVIGASSLADTTGRMGRLFWPGYDGIPPTTYGNTNPYEVFSYCLLGDPALRMDPGAAFFALTQDGRPVDAYAYLRAAGTDSVTLAAAVQGPVGLDSVWVEERASSGAVRTVPRASYSVTAQGDTGATYPRHFQVRYRTVPAFDDYNVDFKARNVNGVVSTSSLHRVLAMSEFTSDKGPLDPSHELPANQTIQIRLDTSVPADSSKFAFYLDGHLLAPTGVLQTVDPETSGGLRHWAISLHNTFPGGLHTLRFVPAAGSAVEKSVQFLVVSGTQLTLGEVINYPNPFATTTGFHYSVSQPLDDLTIRIYTVSGRLVREMKPGAFLVPSGAVAPLDAGIHLLQWDGRDGDGDPLANGVYLFKLTVRAGSNTLEKMGRMIKVE